MTEHALQRLGERAPWLDPEQAAAELYRIAGTAPHPFAVTVTGDEVHRLDTLLHPPVFGIFTGGALVTVLAGGMTLQTPTGEITLPSERKLLGPGLYDLEAEVYHKDPSATPALSASLAHTLISATPHHAWWSSPRLNPDFEVEDKEHYRIGSAAHEILTGKGRGIVVLEHDDLRTKAAKEARDEALAAGKVWLKPDEHELVERMVATARETLARLPGGNPFDREGVMREATIIWEQDGVLNRIMVDFLDLERRAAWDFKTCAGLAEPRAWMRASISHGAHIRAAHYLDGLEAHFGGRWQYVFVPQEKDPPHALALAALSGNAVDLARRAVREARDLWRTCLKRNHWPAYPLEITPVDLPPWLESQILEHELQQEERRQRSRDKPTEGAKRAAYAAQART